MSVKIRPYKKRGRKGWEVDIVLKMPSGDTIRERVKSPVSSISGTKSWALLRELQLLQHGKPKDAEKVPTLEAFTPRFMESYVRANRQKPSTIESKQAIIDGWLHPHLGKKPLNEINDEDVQALKSEMKSKHPKTVNNVLTVLSKVLKIGVKWKVIAVMPVQIELLKFEQREIEFYDDEQYPRLVDGSVKVGERGPISPFFSAAILVLEPAR
jgi:hypothetical protein